MWKLQKDENNKRLYVNSRSNSQCEMDLVKIDRDGNKWWAFNDLFAMPFTRHFAAQKVSALYSLGLTKEDIFTTINGLKKLLNSTDSEKFQKSYALILDFESKAQQAADPVRQMSSLVCVYYTFNDENIDSFQGPLQLNKMSILELDPELHNFFLRHQTNLIETFTNRLSSLSQTSLVQLPELSDHLQ